MVLYWTVIVLSLAAQDGTLLDETVIEPPGGTGSEVAEPTILGGDETPDHTGQGLRSSTPPWLRAPMGPGVSANGSPPSFISPFTPLSDLANDEDIM